METNADNVVLASEPNIYIGSGSTFAELYLTKTTNTFVIFFIVAPRDIDQQTNSLYVQTSLADERK